MSTQELRLLCSRTYEALDTDYPPFEAVGLYQELVEVLEQRESEARGRGRREAVRERFRDNQWASMFELIRNGIVAGYIKYRIDGGEVTLLHLVVDSRFTDVGVEASLVRHTLLDLHRRRLPVTSLCPEISAFIVDHPEFAALLPIRHRHNDARVIPLICT
ncbi:N-acetyltransferase [Arthrobacter sp. Soc17.1.1.1]|uniref:GNAT family N-acetyltransferase n=1 Tax=Arthrobacter sp. Soc17.1.1.1 TaxID=3121277 RepID=UPI002FE44642